MPVAVDVVAVASADRPAFAVLMHDYLIEMAAILSQPPLDPYPGLELYWSERNRWPYWIRASSANVGFALVRRDHQAEVFDMAEFFVSTTARRGGIGLAAARAVLRRHPGRWRITQREANRGAIAFWHRVLQDYPYREEATAREVLRREQWFTVPAT